MDSGDNSGRKDGPVWAIGLMSGTSADGIDAALIRTDGTTVAEYGPSLAEPYDNAFRVRLKGAFGSQAPVPEIERELTERHAHAVKSLLAKSGRQPREVAVVGFHGQTLHHAPERRQTWQIG